MDAALRFLSGQQDGSGLVCSTSAAQAVEPRDWCHQSGHGFFSISLLYGGISILEATYRVVLQHVKSFERHDRDTKQTLRPRAETRRFLRYGLLGRQKGRSTTRSRQLRD